jgi:alpha-tubulin suppressor-like RCC1 family protein
MDFLNKNDCTNFEIENTTLSPLYNVLENMDYHLTSISSVVCEASHLDIPSIVINESGIQMYQSIYVDHPLISYILKEDEIIKIITAKPTKIKNLTKYNITNVKSEGDINFAISKTGEAFMWPWRDKQGNIMFDPIKLPFNNNDKIVSVACGNNFVLLVSSLGCVYSMGKSNDYGQLGHGDTNPRHRPTLIEFFNLSNERITEVSCGYKHCVAKSSVGHAFTWGLVNYYFFIL